MLRKENFNSSQLEFLNENCNYSNKDTIFLSFDIDWAPDYMLDLVANLVSGLDVSFMHTHNSPSCKLISKVFPNGIHPNIQEGSDQGKDIKEVIEFQKKLDIDFTTCRFHVLKFGYPDLVELSKQGTKLDSSCLLFNGKNILPTYHSDIDMIMAPYFWEDGIFLNVKDKLNEPFINWETKGLKIFDFHPLDIYLNTLNMAHRNSFKNVKTKLQDIKENVASKFINSSEYGTRNILIDLVKKKKEGLIEIKSLKTLNKEFREWML